jgi:hypothetical protein
MMKRYDIEVIHEPSGAYMNFSVLSDKDENEMDIFTEFIKDISIVVIDEEEVEEDL